jgi:signal transduction histidine kinase
MHPNETRIYIAVLGGVLVLLVLVVMFVITIVGYHRKKLAFHLKNIGSQINYLDQQCEKIAADLHDDLGASLSGIKMRLQCIKAGDADTLAIINFSKYHIDEVMYKLRLISFNMIPDLFLQKGLEQALRELLSVMTDAANTSIDFCYDAPAFDKERAMHIYRIVQELLNNTMKHSGASAISCQVQKIKKTIQLQFRDNGKGFNKDAVIKEPSGVGLKNIMTRADLLRAKIYITTAPAQGAAYLIEIPAL